MTHQVQVQIPEGAGHLFRCHIDLRLKCGSIGHPNEIPVVTGYLMRICEIS